MNLRRSAICLLLSASCLLATANAQVRDFTRWVDPFIGTGGHGHTFPGATMPFGMVQLSPDTRIDNWDGSSGYHYSDNIIYGFSHTHLSGTGIPDGCDILVMPTVGEPQFFAKEGDKSVNGYASKFSHANEKAEPGYYSVRLDDDGILAEMTATKRVGFHRYTFPKGKQSVVMLDLKWRDKVLNSELTFVGNRRIEGFRESSSWARRQKTYFVAEFSEPFVDALVQDRRGSGIVTWDVRQMRTASKKDTVNGDDLVSAIRFGASGSSQVLLRVSISFASIEGARANLAAELPGWDFDKVRVNAKAAWNKELSKIEVSGGTDEQSTNFYTALYHTMIHPNVFNDIDGKYKGHDGKVHKLPASSAAPLGVRRSSASPGGFNNFTGGSAAVESRRSREVNNSRGRKSIAFPHTDGLSPQKPSEGGNTARANPKSDIPNPQSHYTVFSLWDTFRAAHPLYTIIDQRRTVDYINTFIRMYEQGGRLPVWELWGEETDTMIGYHAVSVIADAMSKGIEGFDYEKAYRAAKHSAELDHFGLASYKKRGYITSEEENEAVSKTLEYAYNDYCIATMAQALMFAKLKNPAKYKHLSDKQLDAEANKYFTRSMYYRNLFDSDTGFMRPRRNGGFVSPFAPNEVSFHFTEGNSWQYSFFVPHDISALAEMHGGKINFAKKLDDLFTTEQKLSGREQPDITGLIGQYAHGNEPSHHMAFLYNYANQPWKTQSYTRRIMDEFYKNAPDGLIGNEDCGQMSAWYVLSALGFYQVNPSRAVYDIGTPIFKEARINLENGKTFVIKAPNVSSANKYIRRVTLNGKPHRATFFQHRDLMAGGVLEFDMAPEPVTDWFTDFSYSGVGGAFTVVPTIDGERVFKGRTTVTIKSPDPDTKITYTVGGQMREYTGPFTLDDTTTVEAYATDSRGRRSMTADATFKKRGNDWSVKIVSPYSYQYTGGGDDAIIDGVRGTTNFTSDWQGFQGKTFEAVIDLQRDTEIKSVGGSFLQVARSWIWIPERVEFEVSHDGVTFQRVADIKPGFPPQEMNPTMREVNENITPVRARYVRVRAFNFGKIPSWHIGAGGDPWIFVDEIFVK